MSTLLSHSRRAWKAFAPGCALAKQDVLLHVNGYGRRAISVATSLLDGEEDTPASKGQLVDSMQDNSMKELLCLAVKAPLMPGEPSRSDSPLRYCAVYVVLHPRHASAADPKRQPRCTQTNILCISPVSRARALLPA